MVPLMSGLQEADGSIKATHNLGNVVHQRRDTRFKFQPKAPMRGRTKTSEALGIKFYGIEDSNCVQEGKCVSWDNIAGYYDL